MNLARFHFKIAIEIKHNDLRVYSLLYLCTIHCDKKNDPSDQSYKTTSA